MLVHVHRAKASDPSQNFQHVQGSLPPVVLARQIKALASEHGSRNNSVVFELQFFGGYHPGFSHPPLGLQQVTHFHLGKERL